MPSRRSQPLSAYPDLLNAFQGVEDAAAYFYRREPSDISNDFEEVREFRSGSKLRAQYIYQCLINLNGVREKKSNAYNDLYKRTTLAIDLEATAWLLVKACADRHEFGLRPGHHLLGNQRMGTRDKHLSLSERWDALCAVLSYDKLLCADAVKGEKLEAIVHKPIGSLRMKIANKSINDSKAVDAQAAKMGMTPEQWHAWETSQPTEPIPLQDAIKAEDGSISIASIRDHVGGISWADYVLINSNDTSSISGNSNGRNVPYIMPQNIELYPMESYPQGSTVNPFDAAIASETPVLQESMGLELPSLHGQHNDPFAAVLSANYPDHGYLSPAPVNTTSFELGTLGFDGAGEFGRLSGYTEDPALSSSESPQDLAQYMEDVALSSPTSLQPLSQYTGDTPFSSPASLQDLSLYMEDVAMSTPGPLQDLSQNVGDAALSTPATLQGLTPYIGDAALTTPASMEGYDFLFDF